MQVVDFSTALPARSILLWRITFKHLLLTCKDDAAVQSVFGRLVSQDQLGEFRASLVTFLRLVVGPWLAEQEQQHPAKEKSVLHQLRLAEVVLKGRN